MLQVLKTPFSRNIKLWVLPIVFTLIFVKLINSHIFIIAYIPSGSMESTINIGDKVLCISSFLLDTPKQGDIVVFEPKAEDSERASSDNYWIKRVIGTPGDKVRVLNGKVFINNEELQEDYVTFNSDYTGSFVVPKNKYLVFGDNRADSYDGRMWDNPYISESQIKYKAIYKVYPLHKFGKL